jgi:hypothetical protein
MAKRTLIDMVLVGVARGDRGRESTRLGASRGRRRISRGGILAPCMTLSGKPSWGGCCMR